RLSLTVITPTAIGPSSAAAARCASGPTKTIVVSRRSLVGYSPGRRERTGSRRRAGRRAAAPPVQGSVVVVVGRERLGDRGERAASRRGRARALRRARRRRPLRRHRG